MQLQTNRGLKTNNTHVQKIELIIEKGESGIWGSVNYNDNLIVDEANNLNELELQLKSLLKDFEKVDPGSITFDLKIVTDQFL